MKKMTEIAKQALDLLTAHSLLSLPIDVEELAQKMGIKVHHENLEDDYSGMLVIKDAQAHIIVNSKHHMNRCRFTIAHEIGHFICHASKHSERLFVDTKFAVYQRAGTASSKIYADQNSSTSYIEEREANLFAEALLVPNILLDRCIDDKRIDKNLIDEYDVSMLASLFGVSEQMMAIKVEKL